MSNPNPCVETRFVPGVSGNKGGSPRGKRVKTWMAEYGEKEDRELPKVDSPEWERLPKNARIALRRLRAADAEEELGLANSKYVEPREMGDVEGASTAGVVAGIAAAIMALKAAGVELRPVASAEPDSIDAEVERNGADGTGSAGVGG